MIEVQLKMAAKWRQIGFSITDK